MLVIWPFELSVLSRHDLNGVLVSHESNSTGTKFHPESVDLKP